MTDIQKYLLSQADQKYRDFTLPLIPNVDEKTFIGVRLPIVKKYVNTIPNVIINNNDDMDNPPATRIFSDCWNAYSTSDFNEAGYIHHKINHSVWFGQGSFHTNNIEGIWSKIKRLMDNFNGINGNIFNGKNNINNIDYFNSWISLGIFFMNTEHLQFGINAKKNYLISYLKI